MIKTGTYLKKVTLLDSKNQLFFLAIPSMNPGEEYMLKLADSPVDSSDIFFNTKLHKGAFTTNFYSKKVPQMMSFCGTNITK